MKKSKPALIIIVAVIVVLAITYICFSFSTSYWTKADSAVIIAGKRNTQTSAFVPFNYRHSKKADAFAYGKLLRVCSDFYKENGFVNYDYPVECTLIKTGFQSAEYELSDTKNNIKWTVKAKYGLFGSDINVEKQSGIVYKTDELKVLNNWFKGNGTKMTVKISDDLFSKLTERKKQEFQTDSIHAVKCVCAAVETAEKTAVEVSDAKIAWDYEIILTNSNNSIVIRVWRDMIQLNETYYKTSEFPASGIDIVVSELN